ncbi:MAG: hypothetical protein WCX82_00935 [archaeon]|jgi:hypothetical protein
MAKAPTTTRRVTSKILDPLKQKTKPQNVDLKQSLTKTQIEQLGKQARESFSSKLNTFGKYGVEKRNDVIKSHSEQLKKLSARLEKYKSDFKIEKDNNRKHELHQLIEKGTREVVIAKRQIRYELLTGKLEVLQNILNEKQILSKLPDKVWQSLADLRGVYTKQAEYDFSNGKSRLKKMEELDLLWEGVLKKINSIENADLIIPKLKELDGFLSSKIIDLKKAYPKIRY